MDALILAAGVSSRLLPHSKTTPKCLLSLNKKRTALSLLLKNLDALGAKKIIIVTGFHHEKIENYVKKKNKEKIIRFVHNPFFFSTNAFVSLMLAMNNLKTDTLILSSDIVFDHKIVEKIDKNKYPHGCLLARKGNGFRKGEVLINEKKGVLLRVGKNISKTKADGESTGIIFLTKEGVEVLRKEINNITEQEPDYRNHYYHYAIEKLAKAKRGIGVEYIGKSLWAEIDTYKDLKKARLLLTNESKNSRY